MKCILLTFAFSFVVFNSYSQNVGIGTTTPTEKLDVNGNINLSGQLSLANNAGTSGQVLTSQVAGNPAQWSSVAYGSMDRFLYSHNSANIVRSSVYDTIKTEATRYALSASITADPATGVLTINKTGLYKIYGATTVDISMNSTTAKPMFEYSVRTSNFGTIFLGRNLVPLRFGNSFYGGGFNFDIDLHLTAGSTLAVQVRLYNVSNPEIQLASVGAGYTGIYLIAE
jgi:hypothetical protein